MIKPMHIYVLLFFFLLSLRAFGAEAPPDDKTLFDYRISATYVYVKKLKEVTEDIILIECDTDYQFDGFYFCVLSNLYAMNQALGIIDDLMLDYQYIIRPVADIEKDLKLFLSLLSKHENDVEFYGGYDFYEIAKEFYND